MEAGPPYQIGHIFDTRMFSCLLYDVCIKGLLQTTPVIRKHTAVGIESSMLIANLCL